MGIAENPLQPTVGPESWKGKQYGERLGVFHRSSWTTATRSLPQISDKIRGLVALDQTQSGCGVERPHARSLIHFNVRRAEEMYTSFSTGAIGYEHPASVIRGRVTLAEALKGFVKAS